MCTVTIVPLTTRLPLQQEVDTTGVPLLQAVDAIDVPLLQAVDTNSVPLLQAVDSEPAIFAFRLACNRDELRSRPAARPPERRVCGTRMALMPIDPVSDGTWIGVNEAGLAATLLNVNPHTRVSPPGYEAGFTVTGASTHGPATGLQSRGLIVPVLLSCGDALSAVKLARDLTITDFPPFRVVLADDRHVAELRSDGAALAISSEPQNRQPRFFTSSGLGDHVVEGPRRELFNSTLSRAGDLLAAQQALHRHSWSDRTHLSVCMRRPDARTVSYTTVDVAPDAVTLTYHPGPPDEAQEPVTLSLARAR